MFISFEGIDGVGKSTQIRLAEEYLRGLGRDVLTTFEPGGTELGQEIRNLLLHRKGDVAPRSEALLYAADRAHHVATKIRPALADGKIVITDRYLDSSVAYQGAGRVLDPDEVRGVSMWATEGLVPDVTVVLDLDPAIGRDRLDAANKQFDRLEAEALEFHTRVRDSYLAMAAAEPQRFLVVDATLDRDTIRDAIIARLSELS